MYIVRITMAVFYVFDLTKPASLSVEKLSLLNLVTFVDNRFQF